MLYVFHFVSLSSTDYLALLNSVETAQCTASACPGNSAEACGGTKSTPHLCVLGFGLMVRMERQEKNFVNPSSKLHLVASWSLARPNQGCVQVPVVGAW
jgi:hypothetical protein